MSTKMRAVSPLQTPIGSDFFGRCDGEIMSLHYGGQLPFLDWLNFEVSQDYRVEKTFIAYVRPAQSEGEPTAGYLADACATPNGIDYGKATISVEDFGRLGRTGPTRDLMKATRYCKTDPIWRLDGTAVTDEREWDIRFATDVIIQDLSRLLVTGNSSTPGQFDGLERWVRTGYGGANGQILDGQVVNWNNNTMDGGAGVTWNGNAIGSTYNIVDVLRAVLREIRTRISWARQLQNQPLRLGDVVLLAPGFLVAQLLDYFTCWSVCEGRQYNEANLNKLEARRFRDELTADSPSNVFGDGYITIDGLTIPILQYDWELIKGPTRGDMYVLFRQVGQVKIWDAEHLSAVAVAQQEMNQGYFSLDGGRLLGLFDVENECRTLKLWHHPRLFCRAPWANIRISNIVSNWPGGPLSPDPSETSFYPLSSFTSATE